MLREHPLFTNEVSAALDEVVREYRLAGWNVLLNHGFLDSETCSVIGAKLTFR